jgi:glyoxylate reductase
MKPINPIAVQLLKQHCDVEIWEKDFPPSNQTLLDKSTGMDGLITMLTDSITAGFLEIVHGNLKVISQMAVGVDNIDLEAASSLRIPIGHTPGVLTEACADFCFGLILAAARRIVEGNEEIHQGIWRPWGPDVLCGTDVFGSTLGIIGMGRIGQAVARRCLGFKMNVLYNSQKTHPDIEKCQNAHLVNLDELLHESDFVSLHLNLSPETYRFFGKDQFSMMKRTGFLINTSRGSIIDSDSLLWALENKIIAGAAIDVFDPEPMQQRNPILKHKSLIVTPHIASATIQARTKMAMVATQNLLAGLKGEKLPYCANEEVYSL